MYLKSSALIEILKGIKMPTIDRDQLYNDEQLWLPANNVLSETQQKLINEYVITNELPEDDDTYYAQALCLGLKAIGMANLTKATAITSSGVKREKLGSSEIEYHGVSQAGNGWRDFIDSLKDICPIFGYYGLSSKKGIKITSGPAPDINPCYDSNTLDF